MRGIAISLSVGVSVCASVWSASISGTAGPIFTKFCVQIPCGRGSVLLRRCAISYIFPVLWMTSLLAVMGRMATRGDTGAESDAYECLVFLL